jgi:hypothetical protein
MHICTKIRMLKYTHICRKTIGNNKHAFLGFSLGDNKHAFLGFRSIKQ